MSMLRRRWRINGWVKEVEWVALIFVRQVRKCCPSEVAIKLVILNLSFAKARIQVQKDDLGARSPQERLRQDVVMYTLRRFCRAVESINGGSIFRQ
jgi:hypothetical protein